MRTGRLVVAVLLWTFCTCPAFATDAPKSGKTKWVKAELASGTRPEYPWQARRHYRGGKGPLPTGTAVCILYVHKKTGAVKRIHFQQSTGNRQLDQAAVAAFEDWKFKPESLPESGRVIVPVAFEVFRGNPGTFMGGIIEPPTWVTKKR